MAAPRLRVDDEARLNYLIESCQTTEGYIVRAFDEDQIREVAEVLQRHGYDLFSKHTRLFIVLRHMQRLELLVEMINEGFGDVHLPLGEQELRRTLRDETLVDSFIQSQGLVSNSGTLFKLNGGRHGLFAKCEDVPLKDELNGFLGQGAYGSVHAVRSTVTFERFAVKRLPRNTSLPGGRQAATAFMNEIQGWRWLHHAHIVKFIASYTDPRHFGIVMSPIADRNLRSLLLQQPFPADQKSFLRKSYGCLASAVSYIHSMQIRHKDIKPENILVKGNNILLADFGVAVDWSSSNELEYTNTRSHLIGKYYAPEIIEGRPKGPPADVWALGCVFVEMWTVLKSFPLKFLDDFMEVCGEQKRCYALNKIACDKYIMLLKRQMPEARENWPSNWLEMMLRLGPGKRVTASDLVREIKVARRDPLNQDKVYTDMCCM